MTSNDVVYVASGFYEDCMHLLNSFRETEDISFLAFCNEWKKIKFSLIFLCRKTYAEMLEFCEESLSIAKQFTLSSSDLVKQIFGLYLLYGLYYKVPIENVKIIVTLNEWQTLLNFHKKIKDEELYDASFIFVKLVTDNAFYHSLFESEYGLEKDYRLRQDHSIDNPYSLITNITDDLATGELAKVRELCTIYHTQKTKILNETSKNKLELFNNTLVENIIKDFEVIEDKKQNLVGPKKKLNEISSFNKMEKSRCYNKVRPKLGHGFDTDSSDDENLEHMSYIKNDQNLNFRKHVKKLESDDEDDDDDINDDNNDNTRKIKIDDDASNTDNPSPQCDNSEN